MTFRMPGGLLVLAATGLVVGLIVAALPLLVVLDRVPTDLQETFVALWMSLASVIILVRCLLCRVRVADGAVLVVNPLSTRTIRPDAGWSVVWRDSFAYGTWTFRGRQLRLLGPAGASASLAITTGVGASDPRVEALIGALAQLGVVDRTGAQAGDPRAPSD
jgi:hypothetical protein